MKTEDLIAFSAVVRHQSVSQAAEALHVTQSAVTRRIQSLEESLGVQLLDRTTKPLKPSPLGMRVYEQSRTILQELQVLKGLVSERSTPSGAFRLGVPQFISETVLLDVLTHLKSKFPQLNVQVTTALSPVLIEGVESGELDAAAIVLPRERVPPNDMTGRAVAEFEMDVVAQKGALKRKPYTLSEIHELGWVLNPRECGFRAGLEDVLKSKGLPLTVQVDVFGTEVQAALVGAGLGLGLMPLSLMKHSELSKRLQRVEVSDFRLRHRVWLISPEIKGSHSSAIAEFGTAFERSLRAA